MKRSIKLAVAAAVALTATSAFATNGDNLIGLGAKSNAMGGTGVAHYNGAESATSNPALITEGKGTQFTFGGTYFRPTVKAESTQGNSSTGGAQSAESDAKNNIIPYVALTDSFDNGFAIGVSMFGSAGMGTDWRTTGTFADGSAGQVGFYSMRSNLMLLKFSVPVAYGHDNWSVGIAPVLMYGALDMAFRAPDMNGSTPLSTSHDVGRGSSNTLGKGLELGGVYKIPEAGLTLGATYHTQIAMEYKDQISVAATAFGLTMSDKLTQPAEYGIGADWTNGSLSLTADMKKILWGTARGYESFGWENQYVYALGTEYKMDKLALRVGYNYAKNPIKNSSSPILNALNGVMFPAITERHYTVGAGYQFTKKVGTDLAFIYATSPKVTRDAGTGMTSPGLGTLTVTNDQKALAVNLNLKF